MPSAASPEFLKEISDYYCGNPFHDSLRHRIGRVERAVHSWLTVDAPAFFKTEFDRLSTDHRGGVHLIESGRSLNLETILLAVGHMQARQVARDERRALLLSQKEKGAARKGKPIEIRGSTARTSRGRKRDAPLLVEALIDKAGRKASDAVLGGDLIPEGLWSILPKGARGEYLRVAMAAGRCFTSLEHLVGDSDVMVGLKKEIWSACFGSRLDEALHVERAIRETDVLLLGPTGAGKEPVATAIQEGGFGDTLGGRAPAIQVNVGAISESLAETTLFGSVEGAFTDAKARVGLIERCHGGTLFLDEIGDIPQKVQVDLLRVVEKDVFNRVGEYSEKPIEVDVRYVAATHKPLEERVKAGDFREDLFFRLGGARLSVPSLVERGLDDIRLLVRSIKDEVVDDAPHIRRMLEARIDAFLERKDVASYHWPGNVRELKNAVKNLAMGREPSLAPRAGGDLEKARAGGDRHLESLLKQALPLLQEKHWTEGDLCAWYFESAAELLGSKSKAARLVGVHESTTRRRRAEKREQEKAGGKT